MKKILLILSAIVFLTANVQAEGATNNNVTKLYVATFDRAPDKTGLDYWVNSGLSLEDIAKSFFDQDETKALYPEGYDEYDFINAIYVNVFNRDPDTEGADYWQRSLASGEVSKSVFILAVVNGAQGEDAEILDNKTEVGLKFVEYGLEDASVAKNVMENVTSNRQTMIDSFNKIHNISITGNNNSIEIGGDTTNIDNSVNVTNNNTTNNTTINNNSVTNNNYGSTSSGASSSNEAPTISVDYDYSNYGTTFYADASRSYDSDGTIKAYEWRTSNGELISTSNRITISKVTLPGGGYGYIYDYFNSLYGSIAYLNLNIFDDNGVKATKKFDLNLKAVQATAVIDPYHNNYANAINLSGSDSYTNDNSVGIDDYIWTVNDKEVCRGSHCSFISIYYQIVDNKAFLNIYAIYPNFETSLSNVDISNSLQVCLVVEDETHNGNYNPMACEYFYLN